MNTISSIKSFIVSRTKIGDSAVINTINSKTEAASISNGITASKEDSVQSKTFRIEGNYSYPKKLTQPTKNDILILWLKVLGASDEEIARLNGGKVISSDKVPASGSLTVAGQGASVGYKRGGEQVALTGDVISVSGLPNETTVTIAGANAVIHGGAGRDFLDVFAANATVDVGSGDDFVEFRSDSGAIVRAGSGNDAVRGAFGSEGYIFEGGDGHDFLEATRSSILDGGAGDDYLKGDNDSILDGGAGNDTLLSFSNSILDGGDGADLLNVGTDSIGSGGNGNDILIGDTRSILDGGNGNDLIYAALDSQVDGGAGRDHLVLYSGTAGHSGTVARGGRDDDFVTIRGSDAMLRFEAGDGHDRIDIHGVASTVKVESGLDPAKISISRNENDVVTVDFGNGKDRLTVRFKPHKDYLKSGDVGSPALTLQFEDGSTLNIVPEKQLDTSGFGTYKGLQLRSGGIQIVESDTWTELLELMGSGNIGEDIQRSAQNWNLYTRRF